MAIALYISENQYFIGIFRVNGLEMLISLIYKSLTKMHAIFRAFRAIYNFVLHMLNFLVVQGFSTKMMKMKKINLEKSCGTDYIYSLNGEIMDLENGIQNRLIL